MIDIFPGGLQNDWPTQPAGAPPPARSPLRFFKELPVLVALAFGLAILIKTFLVQAFFIPSGSMEPTLHGCQPCVKEPAADRVLVNKLAYRFREPRRGEVIVFVAQRADLPERSILRKIGDFLVEGTGIQPPRGERDFIKRIIGLPGDVVEVTDRGVYVTPPGARRFRLTEPYILDADQQGPLLTPTRVPKGRLFVMGDNRASSSDSRSSLGPIKRSEVIGKAFVKIWPPRRVGSIHEGTYPEPKPKARAPARKRPTRTTDSAGAPVPLPLVAFAAPVALGMAGVQWRHDRATRRGRARRHAA